MSQVLLKWDRNAESDVLNYNIYRGDKSGGPYVAIGASGQVVAGQQPQYLDDTPANAPYYYCVTAVNVAGMESGRSNEAFVAAQPPGAPTGLTATFQAKVTLSVEGTTVAVAQGSVPLKMAHTVKKTTPPKDQHVQVDVDAS